MWNKLLELSDKKQNYVLLIIFIICTFFIYQFSISNTLQLAKSYYSIKSNIIDTTSSQFKKLKMLEAKYRNLRMEVKSIKSIRLNNADLLESVQDLSHKNYCKIRSIPNEIIYESLEASFCLNEIEFEGQFINLVKLLNDIEQNQVGQYLVSAKLSILSEYSNTKRSRKLVCAATFKGLCADE